MVQTKQRQSYKQPKKTKTKEKKMKKFLIIILGILTLTNVSAGTLTGYMWGHASKSCKAEYQEGYQDGLKACKAQQHKRINDEDR